MAKSGIAVAYKAKKMGLEPFVSEFKKENQINYSQEIRKNFKCEFGGHSEKLLDCDLLIVSPGIPLDIPILKKAKMKNLKFISEIEFGYKIKYPASKIIAITGSNGKSTTVSLIHHILKTAGYKSILAGNIGSAFTSFPIEKPGIEFIVLELSSFQLELIEFFKADVAAILNITPDHLNRYNNFEEYTLAKFNIFNNQTENDLAIFNLDDNICLKYQNLVKSNKKFFSLKNKADIFFNGKNIVHNSRDISVQNLLIKGPHNIANIMASILALSPFHLKIEIINKALRTFSPLPHRLEFVAEVNGIKFINDSKATNTESVKYALQSFSKPIRIIMGGAGKGEDYTVLNPLLKQYAKKIYLVGESRLEMEQAFKSATDIALFDVFKEAVLAAYSDAEKGDYVVLSPACTSYDMFNNFEERGDRFKAIVHELKK